MFADDPVQSPASSPLTFVMLCWLGMLCISGGMLATGSGVFASLAAGWLGGMGFGLLAVFTLAALATRESPISAPEVVAEQPGGPVLTSTSVALEAARDQAIADWDRDLMNEIETLDRTAPDRDRHSGAA